MKIIYGPMFSGKTTELLRCHDRFVRAGMKCIIYRPAIDTRVGTCAISQHGACGGYRSDAPMAVIVADGLMEHLTEATSHEAIFIDEAQFMPDVFAFCEVLLATPGKVIVVAALDATSERVPFRRITDLTVLAKSVRKLSAVCMYCAHRGRPRGAKAPHTWKFDKDTREISIGGEEKYIAVCTMCYNHLRDLRTRGESPSIAH
ncbi:MAG: hypothetical protein WC732_09100 [Candidatus Omnitrophota bacterium]